MNQILHATDLYCQVLIETMKLDSREMQTEYETHYINKLINQLIALNVFLKRIIIHTESLIGSIILN